MKSLFSQVGITRRESSPPLHQEPSPPPQMDADVAEVMGSFASPKRFGHHGAIGDTCTLSYEPVNGLLAVASRGGMVKVSGAPGVELVLEEVGSITAEDPPAHLLFPTPHLLVGVTATGAVLAWDLLEGIRSGNIPAPLGPTGLEERVTAAHSRGPPDSVQGASEKPGSSGSPGERYVFVGFESGRVRVVQVSPALRASGYLVDARDVASGAPEGILEPGGFGGALGAVTAITCSANGALALFGHRHGGIVLWDWVRKKRLALRSLDQGAGEEDEDREVTSLAFHPGGEAFAAGFASGCYSVFSTSSSHDSAPPRWVREGGDDGSCPREGPTIVRTAVSLVRWVGVRSGEARAWGLLVAGGIEIEEGEDPDGISLLVPTGHGAGAPPRAKAKGKLAAAQAELETAVFVPFAIGQERLSHVHAVMSGGANGSTAEQTAGNKDGGGGHIAPTGKPEGLRLDEGDESDEGEASPKGVDQAPDELVVLALVTWNEEVRGENGRLQFRRASSIKACPIQTSPYVALLQLEPERIGPHISGFAAATAVASTPLLSSSTIHDFVAYLGVRLKQGGAGSGSPAAAALLRGGGLAWADSVPACARDEGLCTSEMLVVGHADGWLSFWECCGPASRQDGISISEGRVLMREIPSGAALLGSLPAAELAGGEGVDVAVTALDVWIERDHVAASERDACWVAVGFDSGEATVLVLSSRMDAGKDAGSCGGIESGGGTPLATKPVEISDVQLSEGATDNKSSNPSRLKSFIPGLRGRKAPEAVGDAADEELEAAIAEARAEARAIEAQGVDEQGTEAQLLGSLGTIERKSQACTRAEGEEEEGEDEKMVDPQDHLRQEISDAMADEGGWGSSTAVPPSPSPSKLATNAPREEIGGEGCHHHGAHRKASLVQLALRLHGHAVRCVALSYDTGASALALVVADAEGVVSVTDVSTGSASLLPMRAPQTRPCRPSVTIGPLPSPLCRGNSRAEKRGQGQGAAGALFVFLEGWLNVFDLASRDPVDVVQVPGLARNEGGVDAGDNVPVKSTGGMARREDDEEAWIYCVDERGVPLAPYASEPLSSAISPPPSAPGRGFGHDAGLGEGDDGDRDEGQELGSRGNAKTIWVSPAPSRTTLDGYHEHELQVLSDAPSPRPFLLVVRGGVAVVLEIAEREVGIASAFSMLPSANDPNIAAFKGRSGAEMVVRSRMELPRAEGHLAPPRVDRAGVCMVAAGEGAEGKAARRGCLMATDASGILTGFLLPSLTPVFRDRLPLPGDGAGPSPGALPLSQRSVCNLLGELTLQGTAGEFTRWTVLTDEACDKLVVSKPRRVKVSTLVRQATPSERSVNRQPSDGSSAGESSPAPRNRKSVLGRLSLGGSRKSIADVFAVEPSHRPASRPQSGGSAHSFPSTAGAPTRRGRGDRRDSTEAQRKDLFGEREDADGGSGAVGSATAAGRAGGGVSGTQAAVSEARDLAIERGEKLENMVDKTRELEDSALAFGDMAKQLRKQQEDEACSIS